MAPTNTNSSATTAATTAATATATATTIAVDWRVPLEHPAFAGHFPGQPIVPGVLLVAQALEAAAAQIDAAWLLGTVQIAQAKFLAPLRPGDSCTIELQHEASPSMRLRFAIRRGSMVGDSGVVGAPGVLAATGVLARDCA